MRKDRISELEKKLKKYQRRYQRFLKSTAAEGPRWGRSPDELLDIQLRVLESIIVALKEEILRLKKGAKK